MDDLRELYQSMILDHGRTPRNFEVLEHANCVQEGVNPVCGDRLTVYLEVNEGIIESVTFKGEGCAISMASASLMTQALKHQTIEHATRLFDAFHQLITAEGELSNQQEELLDKLIVLKGVCQYPMRVKCATLAWHALKGALSGQSKQEPVTTEE